MKKIYDDNNVFHRNKKILKLIETLQNVNDKI